MPPTGSPDRHGAGASVCRCMPHGFVILTAKPIAGHHAKGPRREPGQDDPDAAGAQDLDPDRRQAPALDHRRAPLPGRRPCPRTPLQSRPPRPRPPRRSSKRLPETPVSLPGITLSYEGGQGERARSRRYLRGRRNLRDYGSDAQNRLFCRFVRLRGVSAAWSRAAGRKGEFGL